MGKRTDFSGWGNRGHGIFFSILFSFFAFFLTGCSGSSGGGGDEASLNQNPNAEIVSPDNDHSFYTNDPVAFTGTGSDSDGTVTSYFWDFGDGYLSTVQNPVHAYTDEDSYLVSLTVTDDKGDTDETLITLHIDSHLRDSDGDGWTDREEELNGTDPEDEFSWDYDSGIWPDLSDLASHVTGTGYDADDIISDVTLQDQHGNDVSLYQFYGYVVIAHFTAGWCAPCRAIAPAFQPMWVENRGAGLIVIHMVVADNAGSGEDLDQHWLADWAEEYGIGFPVLNSYDSSIWNGLMGGDLYEGGLPFTVLLDKDMSIDSGYTGSGAQATILSRAQELLAQ